MTRAHRKINLLNTRNVYIILIGLALSASVNSQDTLTFKYFPGTTDPVTNWKSPDFKDAAWSDGYGSIGYGDNDDLTPIAQVPSVYIRYALRFDTDYRNYKGFIIYPDFDDGFIAWLNGVEILRVNVADSIIDPTHLQTAGRSHEAFGYRTSVNAQLYDIPGYYIDSSRLAACSVDTSNLLAFAVFNDSTYGSDLSFGFHFQIVDSAYYYRTAKREFISRQIPDSTLLPYVVIETNEFGVSDSNTTGRMGIISNLSGRYNRLSDNFTDYNGRIRLKLHGTYSLQFPKKSLRIELQDSTGANNNLSILGLPAENDFILYGPYQDKTLIKNVFTYNIGRKMGYYAPRTRFCDLVLNGSDLGVYVLIEKIKRDKNRVDINKLSSSDNSGIDLTGGYLLQYNGTLEIDYPAPEDITPEQENYINGFINECEKLIHGIKYCRSDNAYKYYIDLSSLADYYIINELSMNYDGFSRSWYMYKDNDAFDGRLKYGPLWDYDVAWNYYLGQGVEGWRRYDSPILSFYAIVRDTAFAHLLINRWKNFRTGILSNDSILGLIDSLTTAIAPAIERNYRIWPITQYTEYGQYVGLTYQDWVDTMKTWIAGRLQWIDENISDFDYNPTCISSLTANKLDNKGIEVMDAYPNPFTDELNLELYAAGPENIQIKICDLAGISVYSGTYPVSGGDNRISMNMDHNLAPGFYMLTITSENGIVNTQKILKRN